MVRLIMQHYQICVKYMSRQVSPSQLHRHRSFDEEAYALLDPDGNKMVFGLNTEPVDVQNSMPGRMQHVVVASAKVQPMIDFYTKKVGFVVSDIVRRDDGTITACFMRSDNEHHSFAVFLGEIIKIRS